MNTIILHVYILVGMYKKLCTCTKHDTFNHCFNEYHYFTWLHTRMYVQKSYVHV